MSVDDLLAELARADDRERLWGLLEPFRPELDRDWRIGRAWAEALRTSPSRPSLVAEARGILERWPDDLELVLATCDALLRSAERRALDEPALDGEAPALAAGAASRCLAKLAAADRQSADAAGRLLATRANALRLLSPKRLDDALDAIEQALSLDPTRGEWHLDRAILHKWRRDFAASLESCRAARALLGDRKPVLFNLAIAATALGEAEVACEAWRAMGIPARAEPGSLPLVVGLPPAELRLPVRGPGHGLSPWGEAAGLEIVAVQPLSPCHGVLCSPSFGDAVADFGDVVLWDAAPIGVGRRGTDVTPRFALLTVLKRGAEQRFRFLALQQEAGQIEALGRALAPQGALYVHAERVEVACPRCAAGDVLVRHEHLPAEAHRVAIGKLLVPERTDLDAVAAALERAKRAHPGVLLSVPGLYEALGRTAEAGKHHQRWGAIERMSIRK